MSGSRIMPKMIAPLEAHALAQRRNFGTMPRLSSTEGDGYVQGQRRNVQRWRAKSHASEPAAANGPASDDAVGATRCTAHAGQPEGTLRRRAGLTKIALHWVTIAALSFVDEVIG